MRRASHGNNAAANAPGNVTQGSLDLSDLANTATFDVSNGVALTASGSCDCQLTGNTKDNGKPPKDNTSVICGGESSLPVGAAAPLGISVSTSAALVGKISGNPSKPLTLKVKGQVHTFNSGGASVGYHRAGFVDIVMSNEVDVFSGSKHESDAAEFDTRGVTVFARKP